MAENGRRDLATPQQISTYLGVPVATLTAWRYRGTGPAYVKVGRHVRYDWRDIECWQVEQTQVTAHAS